ncbi:MAG: BrnT family toxin [Cyclobacteriaceae bacterium]|nr:BrnT family toxin [Cyclobacteriaceae bacterium]
MELISFEWDEKKARANLSKHSVSFDEAQTIFFDSNARMIFDPDHSSSEDRFILLGMSALLRVLIVCHCCRENDGKVIRIISARKANRKEQKQYESYLP